MVARETIQALLSRRLFHDDLFCSSLLLLRVQVTYTSDILPCCSQQQSTEHYCRRAAVVLSSFPCCSCCCNLPHYSYYYMPHSMRSMMLLWQQSIQRAYRLASGSDVWSSAIRVPLR